MTDKIKKGEQKLISAFADVAGSIASSTKKLKSEEESDTKKLKELTTIAKELYAIVKDTQENDEREAVQLSIVFDEECEKWSK